MEPAGLSESNLSADELELRAQGHVGQLPRQISMFATLALAFSITNTWIGYSATFVTPLFAGAGVAVICCLVVACFACAVIAAGLAELASAFPSSGGQYQYVQKQTRIDSPADTCAQLRVHGFAAKIPCSYCLCNRMAQLVWWVARSINNEFAKDSHRLAFHNC